MWKAEWMIRDDHQLVATIGSARELPWSQVLPVFASTTNGRPGSWHRYQPATQLFVLAEATVLGLHPQRWHVSLTVIFAFVLAGVCWVSSSVLGAGLAVLLTMYVSTHWYWHDIFLHLFDGEKFSAVWLTVFSIAAGSVWHRHRVSATSPTLALSVMALSGALAAGSKENMLFLLPLFAFGLWWSRARARLHWMAWAAAMAYVATAALVVTAVFVGLQRGGGIDEYGNEGGLGARLALLARPLPLLLAGACALLLAIRAWALQVGRRLLDEDRLAAWRALWHSACVVAACVAVTLLSQFAFYNGKWPTQGGRYDFPGRLVEPVLYVAAFVLFNRGAAIWRPAWKAQRVSTALLGVWLLVITARHATGLLQAAEATAARSHHEGDVRRAVATQLATAPDRPVIMLAADVTDAEPAYSFARLLRIVERVPNPIFLDIRPIPVDTSSLHKSQQLNFIRQLSIAGGGGFPGRLAAPVMPWASLHAGRPTGGPRPLCVALKGYDAVEITECPVLP